MEPQRKEIECTSQIQISKIFLLSFSLYFAICTGNSLHTNLIQGDDAWIGDAIILLGIAIIALGILIGKPKKSSPPAPVIIDESSEYITCSELDASESKDNTDTDLKPLKTHINRYL
jgi:hypothetical protein